MSYANNFHNVNGFVAMSGFGNTFICDSAIGDDKEIVFPEGYDNDSNLSFRVIFKNGHETVTDVNMTLNDTQGNQIPIVVNKYGNLIPLPTHDMDDGEGGVIYKSVQPNTILEMYYTSDYDGDNNPAYVIIGNPIVLSSETYMIYADGFDSKEYERNQNFLSPVAESFTFNTPAPYDGFVCVYNGNSGGGESRINIIRADGVEKIFTDELAGGGSMNITIGPISKGDKLIFVTPAYGTSNANIQYAVWYTLRDYTGR